MLYERLPRPADRVILQIAYLHRFSLDEAFFAASGETVRPQCGDGFDVTLFDGVHTLKCVLSTALNELVYSGLLCEYSFVCVEEWRRRALADPTNGGMLPPCVILTKLECMGARQTHLASTSATRGAPGIVRELILRGSSRPESLLMQLVPSLDEDSPHLSACPLLGVRRHYLRLESNEVNDLPDGIKDLRESDFPHLSTIGRCEEIGTRTPTPWRAFSGERPLPSANVQRPEKRKRSLPGAPTTKGVCPPIFGRVVRKGALHHFGKLSERTALRFPVKFDFWLAADDSEVRVIVWNRLCEKYHEHVQVNQAYVISDYTLRKWRVGYNSYEWVVALNPRGPHPAVQPEGIITHLLEGHVNTLGPEAGRRIKRELPAPVPTAQLRDAARRRCDDQRGGEDADVHEETTSLSDPIAEEGAASSPQSTAVVRVLAAILRVYPVYRSAAIAEGTAFVRKRWLLVLPADGGASFPIQLHGHHEPHAFEQVEAGALVQFEHMTLHPAGAGAETPASESAFFLRSTPSSCILMGSALSDPDDSHVDEAASWWLSSSEQHVLAPPPSGRTPAPLGALFAELPPLRGAIASRLTAGAPTFLSQVSSIAAQLHAGELRHLLVHASLRPDNPADAAADAQRLAVSLSLHDADATVRAQIALPHADAAGGTPALWLALCRCAKEVVQRRDARPPRCTAQSIDRVLLDLREAQLAVGIDLYKAGPQAPLVEVVAVWSLGAVASASAPLRSERSLRSAKGTNDAER
ncbi:hypothetical protein AB1Y20_001210 [Prymnesium parvum]|uniref:Uncharacterized protein n=1 Tax=Prymnesium parvum TaxID=97485 RepID=A0AB34K8W6_PRYPA